MALEKELTFYNTIKSDLLAHHEGKHILIIGEEQLGVFDRPEDAYAKGIELRGNVAMLIKRIDRVERIETVPALVTGLINAQLSPLTAWPW